jgi:catechol 2,3-dioxygenase-like lactoylglutathione lyase family enzyme
MPYTPISMSHVGATVPDLCAAITWYREVLGMYLLAGPIEVVEDGSDLGNVAASIYGAGFRRFEFAHLCGSDGVGLELFHFDNPKTSARADNFEFWMTGLNHFSITTPDVAAFGEHIASHGGKIRSGPAIINPEKGFTILYAEDPWGTVIELCSHPYAHMWA